MAEQLTEQEVAWLDDLVPRVFDFKQNWQNWSGGERQAALGTMSSVAQQLHDSLTNRGLEPQHAPAMIANRDADTERPFYFHLHALEDLIGIVGRMERPGS